VIVELGGQARQQRHGLEPAEPVVEEVLADRQVREPGPLRCLGLAQHQVEVLPGRRRDRLISHQDAEFHGSSFSSGDRVRYLAVIPPSTGIVTPVTKLAMSLARNSATWAISSGWDGRPIGIWAKN